MASRANERINFGKIKEPIAPPNLIELQTNSYKEFLQFDVAPNKRKNMGLQAVFTEVFPIESYDGKCVLDFDSYEIGDPKIDWLECLREGITYGAPLYVTFKLKEEKGAKEEKVFMGELPLMTPQGTFVINGAERVIVSQLHRSPGIAFEATQHANGKTLHSFRIIPDRGSWYEAQFDTSDMLYVYLDRKKRRRKFLTTTFFRALGYGSDADILKLFYDIEELTVKEAEKLEDIQNKVLVEDAMDADKGIVVARAFEPLSKAVVKQIAELGVTKIRVVDTTIDDGIVIKCMKKDPTKNEEEALKDIYRRLRPGDPPTAANARALIKRLFFDPKRYDLGRVGRYKIGQKLGLKDGSDSRILTKEDLVAATKYLLRLKKGEGSLDDIDHLGSRRVRTVGELLANQCRVGLARTERLVKERMTLFDQSLETMTPQKLINPKALSAVIRDFFGRSQLSQFMDQINPLAELTHKRRLSALGPGGLSRDRAGFEVRDVHPSHYGRICPVETPEGPNIGLIASLATFARVNDFGFLETPYRRVEKGRITGHLDYLTADREETYIVAQANAPFDDKGHFLTKTVTCRSKNDFIDVEPEKVDYMDVSPKQLVSVAASLIPFLEPGRAIARDRSALCCDGSRRARRARFARGARFGRSRQSRICHRQPNHHHRGWKVAGEQEADQTRTGQRRLRLPGPQVHALQRGDVHQSKDPRREGRPREEGPGDRGWSLHRRRRTRARSERARRVHAVEWLQLRGCHPDQPAHLEGRHLHFDSHR